MGQARRPFAAAQCPAPASSRLSLPRCARMGSWLSIGPLDHMIDVSGFREVSTSAVLVRDRRSRTEEEEHDAMKMHEIDIQDYARQLLEAHGARALAEAAQKACAFEQQGENE